MIAEAQQDVSLPNFVTASSPSWIALISEDVGCKGIECQAELGELTDGHSTVALAAFDGTSYETMMIYSINRHLVARICRPQIPPSIAIKLQWDCLRQIPLEPLS